ncbi:MAG: hypothetical protein ACK559_03940, partial [bacterium]
QRLERGARLRHPSCPGGLRDILQLVVEAVVSQQRGRRRLQPEPGVQAPLVERPQRSIGGRCRGGIPGRIGPQAHGR